MSMKSIEVYKGYSIFEAEGIWADAGFSFQVDISKVFSRHSYMGFKSLERARREIDFLSELPS